MNPRIFTCGALALLFLPACGDAQATDAGMIEAQGIDAAGAPQDPPKKIPRPRIDYATVKRLFGDDPPAPEIDNPSTPAKVALGKLLYHEKRLSAGGDVSCATCHDLAKYGADGKELSAGSGGKANERTTPSTWNSYRQFRQAWDGRAATIEELVVPHALQPSTLALADEVHLVARIKEKAELVDAFKQAFPGDGDAVTAGNFKLALGAFARTLATKSRWDAYLDGDPKALSNEELLGLKTFIDIGCTTCHLTRTVGGHMYQKLGLLKPYASHDTGRMALTKSEADKSFFKVPSLVNVEKTAPYLHDGKVKTLEEAVTVMADIQVDKKLTPEQLSAIVAFLKTLTGPLPDASPAAKDAKADKDEKK